MLRSLYWGSCLFALACAGVSVLTSCASGPDPVAFQNRTFYAYMFNGNALDASAFEQPWKPWDLPEQKPNPEYKGVAILNGKVHISRPVNWLIRDASNAPGQRYIQYSSPNEYVFAIYEREDHSNDLWRDIMARYEDDAKKSGVELLGQRVPIATWNTQGRAYVVRRGVAAAKAPFVSTSREYLLRSDHRIVLVQIVHQGDTLRPVSDELYRVIESIEVL